MRKATADHVALQISPDYPPSPSPLIRAYLVWPRVPVAPDDIVVVLELSAAGYWLMDYYPYESVTELDNERLRVVLRTRIPMRGREPGF